MNAQAKDINGHMLAGTLPADPTIHATPVSPAAKRVAFKDEVVRAVREEIRTCSLLNDYQPGHPFPSDIDAEVTVNGAVASGEISLVELYDLASDDFFDRGQRYFFSKFEAASAANVTLSKALLVASVTSEGLNPVLLAPEIDSLFGQPVCYPDDARRAAKSIIECSRRRRLIVAMQTIDVSMRLGERDFQQGISALEKLVAKAKELT